MTLVQELQKFTVPPPPLSLSPALSLSFSLSLSLSPSPAPPLRPSRSLEIPYCTFTFCLHQQVPRQLPLVLTGDLNSQQATP